MVLPIVVPYSTVLFIVVYYCTVLFIIVEYCTVLFTVVYYCTVLCCTVGPRGAGVQVLVEGLTGLVRGTPTVAAWGWGLELLAGMTVLKLLLYFLCRPSRLPLLQSTRR